MKVVMKYVGTTNSDFINGVNYTIVAFVGSSSGLFLGEQGLANGASVLDTGAWELVSITEGSCQQVFP